jgi:hypothetical protein
VDEDRSPEIEPIREERVRALGYDPHQLTPNEQVEIIEIHSACPNHVLSADGGVAR